MKDAGELGGLLGRAGAAVIGSLVKPDHTKGFLGNLGEAWRKTGDVQEQQAFNRLDAMNLQLDSAKEQAQWERQDMPKFQSWMQAVQKDPNTPQPAWMSDKFFQMGQQVEQASAMNQYRKDMGAAQIQRARNSLLKASDVNDFNSALGQVDPATRAAITDPDSGMVTYDNSGQIVRYSPDAVALLSDGLEKNGLPRFANNWSKLYQDQLKAKATSTQIDQRAKNQQDLEAQKASDIQDRISFIYQQKGNLARITAALKGSENYTQFEQKVVPSLTTTISNNQKSFNLKKGETPDSKAREISKQMWQDAGGKSDNKNPQSPKVGDVMDGYRFNGGDPADQSNWSKAE